MAFPNNPSNGDTFVRYGRTYQYDSTMLMWKVPKSGILLGELADIDVTTNPPIVGDALRWSGSKFEPETVNTVTVYQTDLPLSGNSAGDMAYITDLSSLYIYTGAGWFNVAIINTNPTITVGPDGGYAFATDGTPIVLTLEAQDPEDVPITWSYAVTSGSLGSTATVSQADNVFTITPSTNRENVGQFSITFTASDGVNLATAVSSFTLLFGVADQYYNNNSLLLKSGSTAGLNNTTFVDGSTNGLTVTPTGDVYQGSLSQYSPAGWSGYFDGSTDYLDIPGDAAAFGTSDYTVEGWHYYTGAAATNTRFLIDCRLGGGSGSLLLFFENAIYKLYIGGHVANGGTLVKDAWQHFALVRSSGSTKLYVNGTSVFTWADSTNYLSTEVRLGRDVGNNDSLSWVGYMSDIRIVKGTAVYTSNFTPPTEPLTAISGTSLLTCQSNRFIDNSTNNFAITRYGDTKAVPFSPYLPSVQYDPTKHGGSAIMPGLSTTKLVIDDPSSNLTIAIAQDFTLEFWVKIKNINKTTCLFDWGFHNNTDELSMFCQSGGDFTIPDVITTYAIPNQTLQNDNWHHIAISRVSNVGKVFIDGTLIHTNSNYSQAIASTYPGLYIGALKNYAGYNLNGSIGDFRIVKGTGLYTTDFTPPTEPLTAISGTALLLNMNNAGIYDETAKNNIQVIGNATTSTTQTKYSDASMYFDGTGDYVTSSTTAGVIGTDNFTIETWLYPTTSGTNRCIINTRTADGSTTGFYLGLTSLQYAMFYVPGGGSITTPQNSILADSWYHIAVVRNANIVNLYLNGVSVGSSTIGSNFTDTLFQIGGCPNVSGSSANYFSGYLEDVRITKGVARYTANFTPPTAPLGFNNAE